MSMVTAPTAVATVTIPSNRYELAALSRFQGYVKVQGSVGFQENSSTGLKQNSLWGKID